MMSEMHAAAEDAAESGPAITDPPPWLCLHLVRDAYVVVEKPWRMLSVPGRGPAKRDSIETRVRTAFGIERDPITVHRLDWETSGLLVMARHRDAHRSLSRQFMHRKVGKSYEAVVRGLVAEDEGALELPLIV